MAKIKDKSGRVYGRLTVICMTSRRYRKSVGRTSCLCKCECDNTKIVGAGGLGVNINSCGCLQRETAVQNNTTHGFSSDKIYWVWHGINSRCYNPNSAGYSNYGGRGIEVCREWRTSAAKFISWALESGYKEGLTIDRIDNNGGYNPSNCRWVSHYVNNNNRQPLRKSNNSGYEGVGWHECGKWRARVKSIKLNGGKEIHLGLFSSIEEAVLYRNDFIRKNNLLNKIQEVTK